MAADVTSNSREQASEQLEDLADLSISGKRCERITQRVGAQREVPADAPLGGWNHRVAVVMVDGGRAHLRDERWGQPRTPGAEKPRWWRESKVSMVARVAGSVGRGHVRAVREVGSVDEGRSLSPPLHRRWRKSLRRRRPLEQLANPAAVVDFTEVVDSERESLKN